MRKSFAKLFVAPVLALGLMLISEAVSAQSADHQNSNNSSSSTTPPPGPSGEVRKFWGDSDCGPVNGAAETYNPATGDCVTTWRCSRYRFWINFGDVDKPGPCSGGN